MLCGVAIGFLVGLTGTGGGIFLSPILLFLGWSDTRTASGIAAVFILLRTSEDGRVVVYYRPAFRHSAAGTINPTHPDEDFCVLVVNPWSERTAGARPIGASAAGSIWPNTGLSHFGP